MEIILDYREIVDALFSKFFKDEISEEEVEKCKKDLIDEKYIILTEENYVLVIFETLNVMLSFDIGIAKIEVKTDD
jgi:hypothetical protein